MSFSTLQALMEETRRPFAHPDRHCRDELAKDLPSALQRREFFNVYQPKVALTNGAVAGVEALVRWRHPRCGILSPDHFITLAEQQGHIDALTRLVMENALHDSRLWLEKSQPFSVSVNVLHAEPDVPGFYEWHVHTGAGARLFPFRLYL
ncbi:EAL domain-containing protein [Oceanimonas sp. NS1]|nr:EAL domain-containing protein [Oceanimonas sp. NS1]